MTWFSQLRWRSALCGLICLAPAAVACVASDTDVGASLRDTDPGQVLPATSTDRPTLAATAPQDAPIVLHHWQALDAIRSDDPEDALHHVRHIVDATAGEHRAAMETIATLLVEGDLHGAQHGIEEMLTGRSEPNLTPVLLHLQLALQSLVEADARDAHHHLSHIIDTAQQGERQRASAIAELLDEGHRAEAVVELQAFAANVAQDQVRRRRCATPPEVLIADGHGRIPVFVVADAGNDPLSSTAEDAGRTIRAANNALSELGVSLAATGYLAWQPPPAESLHALADAVIEAFPGRSQGGLLVGFTMQAFPDRQNGIHVRHQETSAIILDGELKGEARAEVLVHEVGHALGLWHATDTYMQSLGMPTAPGWSECQRASVRTLLGEVLGREATRALHR